MENFNGKTTCTGTTNNWFKEATSGLFSKDEPDKIDHAPRQGLRIELKVKQKS